MTDLMAICVLLVALGVNALFYYWLWDCISQIRDGIPSIRTFCMCYLPIITGLAVGMSIGIAWVVKLVCFQ